MFLLVIGLCSGFCPSSFSQVKVKKTLRVDAVLPKPLSNKAFRKLFSAVYNVNLSLNLGIKNFNTGAYIGLMQCQIPEYDLHSVQTVNSAGLRLGYDVYASKQKRASTEGLFMMYSPFLLAGYSTVDYSRLKCITGQASGKHSQTYSLNGGVNFNLMFSEYDGVGFTIGYTFLNHEFNPDPLCITQYYPNFSEKSKRGLTQYLLVGFNWYLDLAKRKNDS